MRRLRVSLNDEEPRERKLAVACPLVDVSQDPLKGSSITYVCNPIEADESSKQKMSIVVELPLEHVDGTTLKHVLVESVLLLPSRMVTAHPVFASTALKNPSADFTQSDLTIHPLVPTDAKRVHCGSPQRAFCRQHEAAAALLISSQAIRSTDKGAPVGPVRRSGARTSRSRRRPSGAVSAPHSRMMPPHDSAYIETHRRWERRAISESRTENRQLPLLRF